MILCWLAPTMPPLSAEKKELKIGWEFGGLQPSEGGNLESKFPSFFYQFQIFFIAKLASIDILELTFQRICKKIGPPWGT